MPLLPPVTIATLVDMSEGDISGNADELVPGMIHGPGNMFC